MVIQPTIITLIDSIVLSALIQLIHISRIMTKTELHRTSACFSRLCHAKIKQLSSPIVRSVSVTFKKMDNGHDALYIGWRVKKTES